MVHKVGISARRERRLALGVSAFSLLFAPLSVLAQEAPAKAEKKPPSTTIMVYNTWMNRSEFFDLPSMLEHPWPNVEIPGFRDWLAKPIVNYVRDQGLITDEKAAEILTWNLDTIRVYIRENFLHIYASAGGKLSFRKEVQDLFRAVNPDTIVYPELDGGGKAKAPIFVKATQNALNNKDEGKEYFRAGDSLIVTSNEFKELSRRRILVAEKDGFPAHIVNGVHFNHLTDPNDKRFSEAKELDQFVQGQLYPVFTAGDFNAADVSERGLLKADKQLESLIQTIKPRDGYPTETLDYKAIAQYASITEESAKDIVDYWKRNSRSVSAKTIQDRNPELNFVDETYPIAANIPVTMNIVKKQNQLKQQERNREKYSPSERFDGRSTYASDYRDEENNIWRWWARANIDHILVSRPFAKWVTIETVGDNVGTLNGRATLANGKDPSDHEPIAQQFFWIGPKMAVNKAEDGLDLLFEDDGIIYDRNKEFVLSRNGDRNDVRYDNITDENGLPIYRDDVDAAGKLGRQLLTDQVNDLISRGLLTKEEGIDYDNDPNAALKMRISCQNKDVLQTIEGAAALCIDDHQRFNNLIVKDGVVAFDDNEALGSATGKITLLNGGLRVAGKDDVWARWLDTPIYTVSKAIELADGVGSFDVTDAGHVVTLESHVSGSGSFEKRGAGDLIMAGNNSYSGATIVRGGTLRPSNSNAFGTSGTFIVHGGRLDLGGLDLTMKHIMGTGGSIALGANSLKLELDRDSLVSSSFEGTGDITKTGAGALVLGGASTHSGQLVVGAGELVVGFSPSNQASTASRVTLESGTRISGNGTVGSLTAKAGSLLAPGNSIGTLSITGDLRTEKGSLYDVELAANGDGDRINVGGTAYLSGGHVTARTLDPETSYINGQRYRIVDAKGGVQGAFDGASTESAFLDMVVRQDPSSVDLQIRVKRDVDFVDTAITENQKSVASAADRMLQDGNSLALYNKLLPLSAAQSRKAYDQLSGEVYAGLAASLIDDNRAVRDAAGKHLRNRIDTDEAAFWSSAYGSWGKSDATDNYESAKRQTKGLLLGGDVRHDNGWLFGAFGGYGTSDFDVKNRGSSASDSNYTVGAYAGYTGEAFGVQFGAANRWHNIDVTRTVVSKTSLKAFALTLTPIASNYLVR